MKFNSIVDALNFIHKNVWRFVDYSEAVIGNKLRHIYLLEKTSN